MISLDFIEEYLEETLKKDFHLEKQENTVIITLDEYDLEVELDLTKSINLNCSILNEIVQTIKDIENKVNEQLLAMSSYVYNSENLSIKIFPNSEIEPQLVVLNDDFDEIAEIKLTDKRPEKIDEIEVLSGKLSKYQKQEIIDEFKLWDFCKTKWNLELEINEKIFK